jgi:hypothetical protein
VLRNQVAALAALVLVSTPCVAFELNNPSPGMMFYVSLPLDARNAKERSPAFGLSFQGKRQYETVNLDSRMFNFTGTGVEAKWIVGGVVAVVAALAVGRKDKSTSTSYQQQQAQQTEAQQQQQQAPGGGAGTCNHTSMHACNGGS